MANPRTFDLNLIRVFVAISRDRSVSRAADQLGLSQSAVSNALNRLRRELDDPLFIRTRWGMQPTPRAEELAVAFHEALSHINNGLSSGATFDPAVAERCFNLLMTDVGEIVFLPRLLDRLHRIAPHIDFNVMQVGLPRYEEMLENGLADLAIGRIRLGDGFNSELIHSSSFVVLTSTSNPYLTSDADGRPRLTFADYLRAPHVNIEWQGAAHNPVRRALGDRASERRLALSISHTSVLPYILERTDLVATVPTIFAEKVLSNQALCALEPPFQIEQNLVYQWWHRRNDRNPGICWLRQILATCT